MLQFWKRSGQKEKTGSMSSLLKNSVVNSSLDNESNNKITLNHFDCSGILSALDDEGLCDIGEADVVVQQSSRLSKTLSEVLKDKGALGYFIQYLESQGGLSYIRCWLDIERCRGALQSVGAMCVQPLSRDQLEENMDVRLLSPLPSSRLDHDSLSVSTDCDSFTADTNSLYDFSSNMTDLRSSAIDFTICSSKLQRNDCLKAESPLSVYCDKDASENSCRLHKLDGPAPRCAVDADSGDAPAADDRHAPRGRALVDSALRIFKKYIAQEAALPIACPDDMRNELVEAICGETSVLTSCFDKVQQFVFGVLESKYLNGYLRSHYHCKYQIDVLTSGSITLADVLYNESILFYFMEFLEQEGAGVLLEFWFAATNFRQQLESNKSDYNPEEAQNDAVILYNKYFSLQATSPLGFGDKVRFLVEENICRESGPLPDCFCQPVRLVEHVLDKNYLKAFLSSQLYFKYLSELICTVQTNGCSSSMSKSRTTSSDCSSEISNTLLAMEDPAGYKRRTLKASGKADMNIDTRQLYDPDSLWKRRKARRLSFGRITDLGRFETDVEPEPDRRTRSRFTRAMRKLVHMEESSTKEEMAWQVAEMIVKDITSVTLADVPSSVHS